MTVHRDNRKSENPAVCEATQQQEQSGLPGVGDGESEGEGVW